MARLDINEAAADFELEPVSTVTITGRQVFMAACCGRVRVIVCACMDVGYAFYLYYQDRVDTTVAV